VRDITSRNDSARYLIFPASLPYTKSGANKPASAGPTDNRHQVQFALMRDVNLLGALILTIMLIPDAKDWKRPVSKIEQQEAGARLQALLDQAMLSQVEAADLIGVDHRTMRRYVLGQTAYPYCVWYVMQVICHHKSAERPNPLLLRKLKREELHRELDKWRDEQSRMSSASRAYARAAEHLRALHDEFVRRDEKRLVEAQDVATPTPATGSLPIS
jgi:predicted transcriptional regulator